MKKKDKQRGRTENLVADRGSKVSLHRVMALDISGIDGSYVKRMENLALVRDGCTGEPRGTGYCPLEFFRLM